MLLCWDKVFGALRLGLRASGLWVFRASGLWVLRASGLWVLRASGLWVFRVFRFWVQINGRTWEFDESAALPQSFWHLDFAIAHHENGFGSLDSEFLTDF